MNKKPVIEIRGLTKSYGDFQAVRGVDFTVFEGDIFGFLGPNGAGKSTTIRMLTSLIKPGGGIIRIFGMDLTTNREAILSRMGVIVEKPDLYGYMSAAANLRLLSSMQGRKAYKILIMEVLKLVGLNGREHDKVKTFSQGMKQRLGLAQALIHDPELIVLDEPSNGLDPQGIVDMRELIISLRRDYGKTIVLSSHLLSEVEMMANRMVIINKGTVSVEGDVQELLGKDQFKVTIEATPFNEAIDIIRKSRFAAAITGTDNETITLELQKNDVPEITAMLTSAGIRLHSVVPVRSLEDYFLNLV